MFFRRPSRSSTVSPPCRFTWATRAAPSIWRPKPSRAKQLIAAERLANEVIAEDRPVEIRFATPEEARTMGVRKIPATQREKLRLIDIRDFDLNACGGTHVRSTGQIGSHSSAQDREGEVRALAWSSSAGCAQSPRPDATSKR